MSQENKFNGKKKEVIQGGDDMVFIYKPRMITSYLTGHDLLFNILEQRNVSPFLDDGRIRFQLQDGGRHDTYRIHDIAYCCYHGIITSIDTWESELQAFLDWKKSNNLHIDHLDNNPHNNTIYNLSLMERSLNDRKESIVARFKYPVLLNTAYVDDKYRVQCKWYTVHSNVGDGCATLNLICKDAKDLVDCLKSLATVTPEWHEALKTKTKWKFKEGFSLADNIQYSVALQKKLANIPEELFDACPSGGLVDDISISKLERAIMIKEVS